MAKPSALDRLQQVAIRNREELRRWLELHHQQFESVWLVRYRKDAAPQFYVPYGEVVDELLCFGWIDSLQRKLDEDRSILLASPRRRGSVWSQVNKEKVDRLFKEGRMREPGLRKIEQARIDGTWTMLDKSESLEVPDDLLAALKQQPEAARQFSAFPPSVRRGILNWITLAKRPETRQNRIRKTVLMAAENRRAN